MPVICDLNLWKKFQAMFVVSSSGIMSVLPSFYYGEKHSKCRGLDNVQMQDKFLKSQKNWGGSKEWMLPCLPESSCEDFVINFFGV